MANTRSGWRTAGLIAGLGCLSIIVVIVGGVIIASFAARATLRNLGDTEPQRVERRIALPPAGTDTAGGPAGDTARVMPLRLTLDLQEGFFTIRPGAPGSDLQVQGNYAPDLYELTQREDTDPATGVHRATVRFRSKAPAWARFFAGFGGENGPELTITIPRGAPIDLTLQMNMGRSEVDLGGLMLGAVNVTASMGEHRIDFREPVVEGMRELRFNTSMGNIELENLGNARADTIIASGSMGNLRADLGGAWPSGASADATFEQSMGELTVRVPSNVRVDADVRDAQSETSRPQAIRQPDDPNAPTLRLRVTTSMGNARVVQY